MFKALKEALRNGRKTAGKRCMFMVASKCQEHVAFSNALAFTIPTAKGTAHIRRICFSSASAFKCARFQTQGLKVEARLKGDRASNAFQCTILGNSYLSKYTCTRNILKEAAKWTAKGRLQHGCTDKIIERLPPTLHVLLCFLRSKDSELHEGRDFQTAASDWSTCFLLKQK